MSTITTTDSAAIYYKDWGKGPGRSARWFLQDVRLGEIRFEEWLKQPLLQGSR